MSGPRQGLNFGRTRAGTFHEGLLNRESWKIFQIMAEFVEGFEKLVTIKPSVSIFGSARTQPDHIYYKLTEKIGQLLSDMIGFRAYSRWHISRRIVKS